MVQMFIYIECKALKKRVEFKKRVVKYSAIMTHQKVSVTNMESEDYDRILAKSSEFLAAQMGLGPYVAFGLSYIHGTLTKATGELPK